MQLLPGGLVRKQELCYIGIIKGLCSPFVPTNPLKGCQRSKVVVFSGFRVLTFEMSLIWFRRRDIVQLSLARSVVRKRGPLTVVHPESLSLPFLAFQELGVPFFLVNRMVSKTPSRGNGQVRWLCFRAYSPPLILSPPHPPLISITPILVCYTVLGVSKRVSY